PPDLRNPSVNGDSSPVVVARFLMGFWKLGTRPNRVNHPALWDTAFGFIRLEIVLTRLRQLAARNLMARGLWLVLLVALFGFARPADAQGPPYTFVKLQFPGSVYTDATGINNSGRVVGTYYSADGKRHGYVYDGNTYTTIDF